VDLDKIQTNLAIDEVGAANAAKTGMRRHCVEPSAGLHPFVANEAHEPDRPAITTRRCRGGGTPETADAEDAGACTPRPEPGRSAAAGNQFRVVTAVFQRPVCRLPDMRSARSTTEFHEPALRFFGGREPDLRMRDMKRLA